MIARVQDSPYLRLSDLEIGKTYTKLCYVMNVKAGTSVLGNGYYTFYVKDMLANVVPARLFNVSAFKETGLDAMAFRGKPATLTFETQLYNKGLSIVITNAVLYKGAFDYSIFLGKIESKEELVTSAYSKYNIDFEIPMSFKTMSIQELYSGRSGGMMRLLVSTVRASLCYADLVDYKTFLIVLKEAFLFYAQYLEEKSKVQLIDAKTMYSLLHNVYMRNSKSECLNAIIDACYGLADEGEPKHYLAILLKRIVTAELENADLILKIDAMPAGVPVTINNMCAINY